MAQVLVIVVIIFYSVGLRVNGLGFLGFWIEGEAHSGAF